MNQVLDKSKTLKCKTPITIFSLISLVCILLSRITYFVTYTGDYVDGEWVYESIVRFPTLFEILFLLADIVPCILLVLYILKFHKEFKAKIFMPIIFGAFVFSGLLIIAKSIVYRFPYDIMSYIIYLAQIIVFSLATISALKGFSKKLFPVISLCVGLVIEAYFALNFFKNISWYIEDSMFLYLFTNPMGRIGFISLFIALLLFVLNNKILPILTVSPEKEKKNAKKMNPEQALRLLKDKLDLGMITEEEYQTQRAEIISKL